MKVYDNFEDMIGDEPADKQLEVMQHLLGNITQFFEDNFIETPYSIDDQEAEMLEKVIMKMKVDRYQLVGLFLRFCIDIIEDSKDDHDTIQ